MKISPNIVDYLLNFLLFFFNISIAAVRLYGWVEKLFFRLLTLKPFRLYFYWTVQSTVGGEAFFVF